MSSTVREAGITTATPRTAPFSPEALGEPAGQRVALERAQAGFLAVGATDHAARLPTLN